MTPRHERHYPDPPHEPRGDTLIFDAAGARTMFLPRLPLAATAALALAGAGFHAHPTRADAVAAAASGDVVLLDFAAAWCGPCRQMAGLIGEISAAGWIVRHVDVDHEHDLVRRFSVTGVPCYVLLVKGHEVGRINGATTRSELEKLLAKAAAPLGAAPPPAVAAAPPPTVPGIPLPAVAPAAPLVTEPVQPRQPDGMAPPAPVPAAAASPVPGADHLAPAAPPPPLPVAARGELERQLLAATARLRVEDDKGVSWGTGTVIDCRQGEALILSCGHIFRDSQGKGKIEVDLFAPGAGRGIAGQVVCFDLTRDLALVSVFTETALEPVRVGGTECRIAPGDAVVTVGCNGGADPTIHHSRVTAVDKYLGPPNVQVAGQPVQGRSGGGLFAIDGTLVGVCNAADPADNEGLFAALPSIHEQLEEAGLAFVYRASYPSGGLDAATAAAAADEPAVPVMPGAMPAVAFDRRDRTDALPTASTSSPGTVPAPPASRPGPPSAPPADAPPGAAATLSAGEEALLEQVRQHGGRAEVICIVRPHDAPADSSEVFVLKGSSRDFVEELSRAHEGAAAPVTARR